MGSSYGRFLKAFGISFCISGTATELHVPYNEEHAVLSALHLLLCFPEGWYRDFRGKLFYRMF